MKMMSVFFTLVVCGITFYSTGCLGMNDDGTALLQESIGHLVNYTSLEALDYLNLQNLGSKVAGIAYEDYKVKLGECNEVFLTTYIDPNICIKRV